MRAVVQRVLNAGVTVDGECVGRIGRGYLVLLGVGHGDTRAEADKLWGKLRGLRINEDENGKTNLALADVDGEVLVVSQFTLFADCRHGRRPSFTDAGAPDVANELYEYFLTLVREDVEHVAHGIFGADMKVDLVNDGPFTIVLDTDSLFELHLLEALFMEEMEVNHVDDIHEKLTDMVGDRVKVKANMGRTRVVERMGTIKSVHPAVFIVEVDERRGRKSRQSYQYIDVLTGQVELFDPESGEHIFTPLGNQLEEH